MAPVPVFHAERFAAGGDAIARDADGRVVFVDGALPGETVSARVVQRKRDFARAVVEEVLEASPDRIVPPCPALAAGCGGCEWQHLAPGAQLAAKTDVVRDAFRRTARMPDVRIAAGAAVAPWDYRTTMRLAAAPSGRFGLRARGAHRVVPLEDCLVAHPRLAELLGPMRVEGDATGSTVSLRVSAATGERTAWLEGPPRARLAGLPSDIGLGPAATLHEVVAGRRLRVSASSFFQSGPAAAELLVDAVGRAIGDHRPEVAVDAYGGVGLFAATVLGAARQVVSVEVSPSACADARANLAPMSADVVEPTVVESTVERWRPIRADLVVADPARTGLGAGGVERLVETGAARLVLVSCDPVAAARDAALLAAAGYRHAGSEVLDLFPNTVHMEVVTRFDR